MGQSGRRLWYATRIVFLLTFIVAFEYESRKLPISNGDGWEYWYQAESFHRHGSPELWQADMEKVDAETSRLNFKNTIHHPYAYASALDGRLYGLHFWVYGLSAALPQEYQLLTGRSHLADLVLANVCWYFIALAVVLFGSDAPIRERLALASCAAIGPLFWYVEWTGAEVFSWSLTLISVVAYRDRRYGIAGFAAGLASTQNPTIIFMGVVAALQAAFERKFRSALFALAGASIALIPFGFFQYHFGKPSLIAEGPSALGNISLVRTWSLIGDFNQGLLPYVPVVVIGMLVGVVRMVVIGNVRGLVLAAGGLLMAIGTEVAHNWNSSCDGLQRYLVWMLPVAAGVAVEGIGGNWRMWLLATLAAATNFAIFQAYNQTEALNEGYMSHTPLTELVLTHCPRVYWADPEVFIERQRHEDGWPLSPADFPVAHIRKDGTVSKMILDPASVEKVAERFEVDPEFMTALRERASSESGVFYSHPKHGAVRERSLK